MRAEILKIIIKIFFFNYQSIEYYRLGNYLLECILNLDNEELKILRIILQEAIY